MSLDWTQALGATGRPPERAYLQKGKWGDQSPRCRHADRIPLESGNLSGMGHLRRAKYLY